jgi:hypothetical protein
MDESADTSRDEHIPDAVALARNMRNNGASLEAIAARPASRGFDGRAIAAIMSHVPAQPPDNIVVGPKPITDFRAVLIVVGFLISGAGRLAVPRQLHGAGPDRALPRIHGHGHRRGDHGRRSSVMPGGLTFIDDEPPAGTAPSRPAP